MADQMIELAQRFRDAMEARDVGLLGELYDEDVIVWHSHDDIEQKKADALAGADEFLSQLSRCEVELRAFHTTDVGFVHQHRLVGETKAGKPFASSPLCVVAVVRDNRFVRLDEYVGIKIG